MSHLLMKKETKKKRKKKTKKKKKGDGEIYFIFCNSHSHSHSSMKAGINNVKYNSASLGMLRSFSTVTWLCLPFRIKILNSKFLIPEKNMFIFSHYIWMHETFCEPPISSNSICFIIKQNRLFPCNNCQLIPTLLHI